MTPLARLLDQMRRAAVLDAIRHELTERNNGRIANGQPAVGKLGAWPRPGLPWLAGSMERARELEERLRNVK